MKIAIVILNWNGRKMLETYLPSVIEYSPKTDVIVADNASTDDSIAWLNEKYPQVEIIKLSENYGFAGGYNRALKSLDHEYYILLNSDVLVTPHWLDPLIKGMEQDKSIVACQPILHAIANPDKFEYAGAAGGHIDRYGYPFCRGRIFNHIEKDNAQYNTDEEIFWATGACLMVRKDAFWNVGGFDERFFAHCEEIDLCWRLKHNGGKIYCFHKSIVYHLGGGTLHKSNPKKTFLNFRNNLTMLWKNLPAAERKHVMRARWWLDYIAALQTLLLERNYKNFKAIIEARKAFKAWRKDFEYQEQATSTSTPTHSLDIKPYSILWQYYIKRKKRYQDLKD